MTNFNEYALVSGHPRDTKKRSHLLELAACPNTNKHWKCKKTNHNNCLIKFGYICCCSDVFFLACGGILRCRLQANKSPKADATSKFTITPEVTQKKSPRVLYKGYRSEKMNKRWYKKWVKLTNKPTNVRLTTRK